jgi:carbonic anhydrase/acetyltransferase-like protein (isoleucine patch superfamily)
VKIGSNVVLWSGNHIGHHSTIHDNCFIASHAVVSGFCDVGENSFVGVNATLANNVNLGKDNWIGPNVAIMKDTEAGALYKTDQAEPAKTTTLRFFKIKE